MIKRKVGRPRAKRRRLFAMNPLVMFKRKQQGSWKGSGSPNVATGAAGAMGRGGMGRGKPTAVGQTGPLPYTYSKDKGKKKDPGLRVPKIPFREIGGPEPVKTNLNSGYTQISPPPKGDPSSSQAGFSRAGLKSRPPATKYFVAVAAVVGDIAPRRDYMMRATTTTVHSTDASTGDKHCVSVRLKTQRNSRIMKRMRANGTSEDVVRSDYGPRGFNRGFQYLTTDTALDWPTRRGNIANAGLNQAVIYQNTSSTVIPTFPTAPYTTGGFYPLDAVLYTPGITVNDYNALYYYESMNSLFTFVGGTAEVKGTLSMTLPVLSRSLSVEVHNRAAYTACQVDIWLVRNLVDSIKSVADAITSDFIDSTNRNVYSTGTSVPVVLDNYTASGTVNYTNGVRVHRKWSPTYNNNVFRDDYEVVASATYVLKPHDIARFNTTIEMNGFDYREFKRRFDELPATNTKMYYMAGDYQYLIRAHGGPSMLNCMYRTQSAGVATVLDNTLTRMSAPADISVSAELSTVIADRNWFYQNAASVGPIAWTGADSYWQSAAVSNVVAEISNALARADRRYRSLEMLDIIPKQRFLMPMENAEPSTILNIAPQDWTNGSVVGTGWVASINVHTDVVSAAASVTDTPP